LLKFNFLFF